MGPFTFMGPFTCMGPFTFMGPFTCMGPFRFCVALLHLYRVFPTIWGHFTQLTPLPRPVGRFGGGLRRLWSIHKAVSVLRSNGWLLSTYKFWQRFYQLCCSIKTLPRLCGFRAWFYQLRDAKHRVYISRCVMQQTKRPVFVLGVRWQNKSTNGVVVTIRNVVITQSTGLFFRQWASTPS